MKSTNFKATIEKKIREIKDFPTEGISYKDITPLLHCPKTSTAVVDAFEQQLTAIKVDAIVGIESRGFLFGMLLANRLEVPFVPIRKASIYRVNGQVNLNPSFLGFFKNGVGQS